MDFASNRRFLIGSALGRAYPLSHSEGRIVTTRYLWNILFIFINEIGHAPMQKPYNS
jgi:hypothetical protein